MKKIIIAVLFALLYSGLFALTKSELMNLPSKKTDFYGGNFSSNVMEKIRPLEGNAAAFIADFDECYEYKNHELSESEKSLFLEYFSYLPEKMKDCFIENVYAVYFIDGMWYGGLTDFIFDENQNVKCVLYLNIDTFYKNLTEWFETRDNTIFNDFDDNNKVKVECCNQYKAFLHVLVHETAHVYDYVNNVTPYMDQFETGVKSNSVFYNYWTDKYHPVKKYANKDLTAFSYYYFGNQISVKKAKGLLNYLAKTPFSTLYGAKNFQDDFAETVTFYCFQKKFGINYKITYIENGKSKASYNLESNQNVHVWDSLCMEITGY